VDKDKILGYDEHYDKIEDAQLNQKNRFASLDKSFRPKLLI
jgi:hypothetical protein